VSKYGCFIIYLVLSPLLGGPLSVGGCDKTALMRTHARTTE
jgi:hypothetical protein